MGNSHTFVADPGRVGRILDRLFSRRTFGYKTPLLSRWFILGKAKSEGRRLCIHFFHHSDHDRALHDHPWNFVSLLLWPGYYELVDALGHPFHHNTKDSHPHLCSQIIESDIWEWAAFGLGYCRRTAPEHIRSVWRRPGSLLFRKAEHRHAVSITDRGSWSLVYMAPARRAWGFWCPSGWRAQPDFDRVMRQQSGEGDGCA